MAAWPPAPCASAPAGCRPTTRTCPTRWTSPPIARLTRPVAQRASISPRHSPARPRCWCCPTACTQCATCLCRRAGPMSMCRSPPTGVPAPMSRCTYSARRRMRNRDPGRAIGLAWVGIDPAARKLPVAFDVADKYPPRDRAAIRLRTAPGAWVSLAAVDEGILRLTNFASPDPSGHFLGRRRLGLDIRDDWGRLIAPPDGAATMLRQGGDEGSFVLPDIPQKYRDAVRPAGPGRRRWRGAIPARPARLRRPGAADGRRLERQQVSAPRRPTSMCATRWWPSRCCPASWRQAIRRG